MAKEEVLYLSWIHVETPDDEHVLDAADDPQVPDAVDRAEVPRPQPTVRRERRDVPSGSSR